MKTYFTIGIAGHIDHGKTALTKALTGINTDQLKEEKERLISIEPGFAPLIQDDELEVAIIDVPGHEDFIRQMIAGVAGIDMIIIVIAADEGIMPQTKEHINILSLLGITNGLIVITKIDETNPKLIDIVIDDVNAHIKHTFLEGAPLFLVDSISHKGINELKKTLITKLNDTTKEKINNSFRLPIDQVFTVKGQGVIVRGTIYDGNISQGDRIKVWPKQLEGRVRQIQSHHKQTLKARAGQRTAINIGGIAYEDISRGDVLVTDDFYSISNLIDIAFYPLKDVKYQIKQRQLIKLHVGTAEVMGHIIFFDRNEIIPNENEEILCQIELKEAVVVARGDRFILRRPTPIETIGGGSVIEPNAVKHRYGKDTIIKLQSKKDGSTKERVELFLNEKVISSYDEIVKSLSITKEDFYEIQSILLGISNKHYTLQSIYKQLREEVLHLVKQHHNKHPMQQGIDKAVMVSKLKDHYPKILLEFTMERLQQDKDIKISQQYVSLYDTERTLPKKWQTTLETVENTLIKQKAEVDIFSDLLEKENVPERIQQDFYHYLLDTKKAYDFDEQRIISNSALDEALVTLKKHTKLDDFTLQDARKALGLSRKNLVPLLELLDKLGHTNRVENYRKWNLNE